MGFWQGMNEGLTYVLDQRNQAKRDQQAYDWEREKFNRGLLETRRESYLKLAADRSEKDAALKQQVALAHGLGLTTEVAVALQNSGQLSLFLDQYDKKGKIDKAYISELNDTVSTVLKGADDATKANAMIAGVSTDRDVTNPQESAMALSEAILSATSMEDLDKVSASLYKPVDATALPAFDINFGVASGPDSSDTKAMRSEIAAKLQPYFKESFAINPYTQSYDISQSAPPEVLRLFNAAEETARRMAYGPSSQLSPTDAAAAVSGQIEAAVTGAKGSTATDILNNFDLVMTNPVEFAKNFTPAPRPEVTDPEGEAGQMAGALADSASNADGFNSILDENYGM